MPRARATVAESRRRFARGVVNGLMGHFTTGVSVLQDLLVNLLGTLAALGFAITGTVKISGLEIFISSCFVMSVVAIN